MELATVTNPGEQAGRAGESSDQRISFSLSRSPGFGFCPDTDSVFSASATSEDDGTVRLAASFLQFEFRPLTEVDSSCFPGDPEINPAIGCYVAVPAPPITLNAEQVAMLSEALEGVPDPDCRLDPNLACDPCLVSTYRIGERSISPHCCGDLLNSEALHGALQHIEELVNAYMDEGRIASAE